MKSLFIKSGKIHSALGADKPYGLIAAHGVKFPSAEGSQKAAEVKVAVAKLAAGTKRVPRLFTW